MAPKTFRRFRLPAAVLLILGLSGALQAAEPTVQTGVGAAKTSVLDRYYKDDLLLGKQVSRAECDADPSAVFVSVNGDEACISYRLADESGGVSKNATFYVHDDRVFSRDGAHYEVYAGYESERPSVIEGTAKTVSNISKAPFVYLARPGVFGSSGVATAYANSKREVKLLGAAIDAIKLRHGFDRIGLAGHLRGGAVVATLAAERPDVRCAAASSSFLAVKPYWLGRNENYDGFFDIRLNDPIDVLASKTLNRDLRFFYLVDRRADGLNVPSQETFFAYAETKGFPVTRIEATAPDPNRLHLFEHALRAVFGCMDGRPTDAIVAEIRDFRSRASVDTLPQAPPRTIYPPRRAGGSAETSKLEATDPADIKDAVEGIKADRARCETYATAVWVTVEGRQDCVRYFYSDAGGRGPDAIVYFPGDVTKKGEDGKITPVDSATRFSAATFDNQADTFSRAFGGPVIIVARPGLLGSSGHEIEIRHTKREVALMDAALDEMRMRHRIRTFHVTGQSGGGGLAFNLASKRRDVGCAVSGSGSLAQQVLLKARNWKGPIPAEWRDKIADPYDQVNLLRGRSSLRLFLLADEKDTVVPVGVAEAFARRLAERGVPHTLVRTTGFGKEHHGLSEHAMRAAIACALGGSDADVLDVVEKSVDLWKRRGEFEKQANQ
jgi:dienelactone hydrolase